MAVIEEFKGMRPKIGNNVYLAENVVLVGDITIGDNVSIWWGAVLRGDCGAITIGRGSNIQDGAMIHATTDHSTVELGENVTVGHHALIHGAKVRDGALVGMKSTLLDLAVIGEYAIVAAGAVVPERMEVPADTLVAGVPAKLKKELPEAARTERLDRAQEYRDLAAVYLAQRAQAQS